MEINPIRDLSFKKDSNNNNNNNNGGGKKEKKAKDINIDFGNVDLGTDSSKKGDSIDLKAMVGITVVAAGLVLMYSQPTFAFVFLLLLLTVPPAYSNEKTDESVIIDSIRKDPLIFDLNKDGVLETTNVKNGIFFDHENDGFAEASAWVGENDGILVIDTNSNNEIDNGTELVTATTIASFDTNNDGIIDINDTDFVNLKILKGDGTLLTLSEAGIQSINLSTVQINDIDDNGNEQVYESTFTRTDGTTGKYGEFLLNTNTSSSLATELICETDEISALPDLVGKGNVYSLHQAMLRDESGELQDLIENFVSETDDAIRMELIDGILAKWTGVGEIETGSRGEYIDSLHLAIIEKFMGQSFWSTYDEENGDENINPANPNESAGQILETLYETLKIGIYAELMSQTHLAYLVEEIIVVYDYDTDIMTFKLDDITKILQQAIAEDAESGKALAVQFVTTLKGLGLDSVSNYFDPFDDNCLYTALTKDDRELKWQFDTIGKIPFFDEIGDGEGSMGDDSYRAEEDSEYSHFHAYAGDDVMYGDNGSDNFYACAGDDILDGGDGDDILDSHDGNDIIFGGAGNDTIHAAWGNDIIFGGDGDDLIYPDHADDFLISEDGDDIIRGGKGNDTIHSVVGNDTFIFNLGDGQDTVYEHQGVDTFCFGTDIEWEEYVRR